MITAVILLIVLRYQPSWRPEPPVDLILALTAAILGALVARAGRLRPGPLFPRLWSLAVTFISLGIAAGLVWGPPAMGEALSAGAFAMLAAAGGLLPRLGRRRLGPFDRHLIRIGTRGPWIGVATALAVQLLAVVGLETWQAAIEQRRLQDVRADRLKWCSRVTRLAGSTELGRRQAAHRALAELPGPWPSDDGELTTTCSQSAEALKTLLENGLPSPSTRIDPAFHHEARPQRAGTLADGLQRNPQPACDFHRALGTLSRGLIERLDTPFVDELEASQIAWLDRLRTDWLDGWLEPCFQSVETHSLALETRLVAPPDLPAGRPDLWLDLALNDARELATAQPACALRDEHEGFDRRRRVLDCVLLGTENENGEPKLHIVAELAWVFSSAKRKRPEDPTPRLFDTQRPDTLRMLLAVPSESDFFDTYLGMSQRLVDAMTAAGGRAVAMPGSNPNDLSAWSFTVELPRRRIEFKASKTALPEGRDALLLLLVPKDGP